MNELERLTQAIEHLESQRMTLGDEVVEAAVLPLQEKIAELEAQAGFPELQRKQVTILFADIVASTKIVSHIDPEDTRDIFDNALKRLAEPVEGHNGRVTRFMGDGFKAVFGSPQSHENDPEQAVRAGLDILAVAEKLAEELREVWEIKDFQVRVGVNTGLVAVGGITEAEDTFMGSPVNLAARVERAAPPDGMLISHDSYRHIRGIFDIKPLEPISAKGFDQPVPVYQVLGVKPRSLRLYTRGVEGIETRMVGRESEFKFLQDARQMAVKAGQGQMITISGEAGIGKSRLLFEYQNWEETLPETLRLFLGRGRQETQGQPYAMWRDMFTYRFKILDSDSIDNVIKKLEAGFGEIFGKDQAGLTRAHFIGQLIGFDCSQCPSLKSIIDDPQQLRERATRYLVEYFTRLSDVFPVILILEDLHWVDDSSLDLVSEVGSITPGIRLLIISVTRSMLFERRPSWGSEQEFHTVIKLQQLTKVESKHLVDEILQRVNQVPEELIELVSSTAEGNPFYIEELLKMLIDSGVIIKGEPSWWVEPHSLAQVEVPPTLTGVLQARLDSLPAIERQIMQLAAVIGKDFWDQTILQVSEASEVFEKTDLASQIMQSLASLQDRELIFDRKESAFAGAREYSFQHILFRDVTYETILKRERIIYHGLIADWLVAATQINSRSEEFAAVIAEHYLSAGSEIYASDWFYRAGLQAKAQVAMQEARNYLTKSLELLPPDDLEKRWQVLIERDEIFGILGDIEGRKSDDQALINIAQNMGDDNKLAHAYYRLGFFYNSQGQYRNELDAYEKALAAAKKADDRNMETQILGLKVACLTRLGEMHEAGKTADLALNHAFQLKHDDTFARTLINVSIYYENGDIFKAVNLLNQAIDVLGQLNDQNLEASCLMNIGYLYILSGFPDSGIPKLERSLKIAELLGNRRLIAYNKLNLGLANIRLSKYLEALDILNDTASQISDINDQFANGECQSYLGLALESSGQFKLAERHFNNAWEMFNQIEAQGYAMDALAGQTRCFLNIGQLDQAIRSSERIWDFLTQNNPEGMEFLILAYLTCAEVFEKIGDDHRRRKCVEEGYQQLMNRAEKISDPNWKKNYIQEVPEHFDIYNLRKKRED